MPNTILVSIAEIALNASDTSGVDGDWAAKDLKRATVIYESQQRIQALEDAASSGNPWTPDPNSQVAQIQFKRSRLEMNATDFRLDETNPCTPLVVHGQTVHEMEYGEILHFGDGFIPLTENTAMDLIFTAEMRAAQTNKNIKLTVKAYDENNTLLKTTVKDNILVPDDTSEFEVTVEDVLGATTVGTETRGRFEIIYEAATNFPHTNRVYAKIAEVRHAV